jgi:hypothetical protein
MHLTDEHHPISVRDEPSSFSTAAAAALPPIIPVWKAQRMAGHRLQKCVEEEAKMSTRGGSNHKIIFFILKIHVLNKEKKEHMNLCGK